MLCIFADAAKSLTYNFYLAHEQDMLWAHTRELRERRQPVVLSIESTGKKKHGEPQFEFVRKKKHHDRKPSPSPLVTFLAGGRPR